MADREAPASMDRATSEGANGNGSATDNSSEDKGDRLQQAFSLALSDLYEANAAVQICNALTDKNNCLAAESVERQQVWGFIEQAVSWKLAMALERLTQPPGTDRASLLGLIREIDAAKKNGRELHDERRFDEATVFLKETLAQDTCKNLKTSRDAFMGHSLIGKDRVGIPLGDLIEFLGTLEAIADDLHRAVFGVTPPMDEHIETWQELAFGWADRVFPPSSEEQD